MSGLSHRISASPEYSVTAVLLTKSRQKGHYTYLKTNETLKYKPVEFFVENLHIFYYYKVCPKSNETVSRKFF